MTQTTVCFIGAGNMSRSIISGMVTHGYDPQCIYATNPSQPKLSALQQDFGIHIANDNLAIAKQCNVIVLSVKPQLMQQVCQQLSTLDLSSKLIITIAAGIPASRYHDYFKQPIQLIRTMPNTPTQIGFGMTGLYAQQGVSEQHKQLCQLIMQSGGKTLWVQQEDELNQVIALAGSSPAYFFLFLESMVDAGKKMGMDETQARELAQQAALGAAQMVIQNPQTPLATLRSNVTSKGGTTAQAVETFEQGGLRELVDNAMNHCVARANEMAKTF
ncbi:pyrroline-5-carboxylate reductase [Shewanella intestini]|uniref:Pyrroline-5-carboxylate reductase n=1 Tax=Shewanella intestini TaxID=2017544 RepID=A0ABS5I2G8_9GAMM|nr:MULTISPECIES: pyrroline-5-carboxylate reductase [Shewanella]MBR9728222.1 pyrroline-5-carboxylate reductase [Shewanella intestini]MRG35687.1 pyrroline-5-carboxylate reductase [Shewanella sp. XMDDZSB0408]